MRYLHLMSIIEIARKSTIFYSIICLRYYLLSMRYSSSWYDFLRMLILLWYLLCNVLLICTTRFVSYLLDIKTNHMTVVLRRNSIVTSISDILCKKIRIALCWKTICYPSSTHPSLLSSLLLLLGQEMFLMLLLSCGNILIIALLLRWIHLFVYHRDLLWIHLCFTMIYWKD